MNVEEICRSLEYLHPKAKFQFTLLVNSLSRGYEEKKTHTKFRVFETYRTPQRQMSLQTQTVAVTKAGAWESAHNFGLAVDFVGYMDGKWSWDEGEDWAFLHVTAASHGLHTIGSWDKAHIQHPAFAKIRQALK